MSAKFWDERYRSDDFAYGREPNDLLRAEAHRIPTGPALCLAESEGRNAVVLAERGHAVTAVDFSAEGLHKTERRARERGVTRWAACLGLLVLTGCRCTADEERVAQPPPSASVSPSVDDPSLERAKRAAQAFSGDLRSALQRAMQGGGPASAVEVCYAVAPAIAEEVMRTHGVRLGRVALPDRNRNPQQAAQGWQLSALQEMQAAVAAGDRPEQQVLVRRDGLPEGVALRMVRGIATEEVCVTCHGGAIAAPVREAIARRYPGDAATGFAVGDLRGALWVEVPAR